MCKRAYPFSAYPALQARGDDRSSRSCVQRLRQHRSRSLDCVFRTKQHRGGHRRRHGRIARVIRMQMVAAIEARREPLGVTRVTQYRVEVGDRIECAARAYPRVDFLANRVFLGAVVAMDRRALQCARERRDRWTWGVCLRPLERAVP